jgi:hypothetical protein
MSSVVSTLFMMGLWLPVLAYIPLQIAALWYARSRSRYIILAPVPIAVMVGVVTTIALLHNSNLWPCWMFVAAPAADVYLVVVMIAERMTLKERRRKRGQCPACGFIIAPGTCADGRCSECGQPLKN